VRSATLPLPVLNCDGCGACCAHIGTPPGFAVFFGDLPRREARAFADYSIFWTTPKWLRDELGAYYKAVFIDKTLADRTAGGATPCLWYDEATRRCRHYKHRPAACRGFKVGGASCLSFRSDWNRGRPPADRRAGRAGDHE